jgi:hypothetical protein
MAGIKYDDWVIKPARSRGLKIWSLLKNKLYFPQSITPVPGVLPDPSMVCTLFIKLGYV